MTPKGYGVNRGHHDLLYDPKGHGDLCGRVDPVYDPKGHGVTRGQLDLLYDPECQLDLDLKVKHLTWQVTTNVQAAL